MKAYPSIFRVDPTPRRADGEYIAHARIIFCPQQAHELDVHLSGDLRGFDSRDDAIRFGARWGDAWIAIYSASFRGDVATAFPDGSSI